VLPALVYLALAAFAAALLGSLHAGRVVVLHLVLAVGAMPLIFGAMSHFIPVLTRTRAPGAWLGSLPILALAGALLAMAAFSLPDMLWGRYAGACVAASAAIAMLIWSRGRRKTMLGRPHPGLAWYEAALACLVLALLAILASAFWPQQWAGLRRLHLHLNTLGFIGLTAVAPSRSCCRPSPAGPTLKSDRGCAVTCHGPWRGRCWSPSARHGSARLPGSAPSHGRFRQDDWASAGCGGIVLKSLPGTARRRYSPPRWPGSASAYCSALPQPSCRRWPPLRSSSPASCRRWSPEPPPNCCPAGGAPARRAHGTRNCADGWGASAASVPCCSAWAASQAGWRGKGGCS